MRSSQLWYEIERVFADLDELCTKVAEDSRMFGRQSLGELPEFPGKVEQSAWDPSPKESEGTQTRAKPEFGDAATLGDPGESLEDRVIAIRSEVRTKLVRLKAQLSSSLTERELHYCLFPIVLYADEMVQSSYRGGAVEWVPLQRELYNVDNGGELFYRALDNLFHKEETLPLIFEVFYFCLNDGFMGKFISEPYNINEYKDRLIERIPIPEVSELRLLTTSHSDEIEIVRFPTHYYFRALLVVSGWYVILWLLGSFEAGN